jgi:class 3 adenylate cyclase
VRLNSRGFGLSDRDVLDFSLQALARDLEAVVDRLNLPGFELVASSYAVPVAITYAASHPERVLHLALLQGSARGADLSTEQIEHLLGLADSDWELASESIMHSFSGWSRPEFAHQSAALMREAVTPATLLSFMRQAHDWDVRDLLPHVAVPTLVVHPRERRYTNLEASRQLAAGITDARLLQVDGHDAGSPAAIGAIGAFLLGREAEVAKTTRGPSGIVQADLTVILFADIADSTALTERLGDAAFRAKARDLDAALRTVIREHSGTPIEGKLLGDGVLAVFTSARQAIEAALACARSGDDAALPLHLGLHAGDVIREENNVYGGAVNIASRISGLSEPGEVLVSDIVRGLARTRPASPSRTAESSR